MGEPLEPGVENVAGELPSDWIAAALFLSPFPGPTPDTCAQGDPEVPPGRRCTPAFRRRPDACFQREASLSCATARAPAETVGRRARSCVCIGRERPIGRARRALVFSEVRGSAHRPGSSTRRGTAHPRRGGARADPRADPALRGRLSSRRTGRRTTRRTGAPCRPSPNLSAQAGSAGGPTASSPTSARGRWRRRREQMRSCRARVRRPDMGADRDDRNPRAKRSRGSGLSRDRRPSIAIVPTEWSGRSQVGDCGSGRDRSGCLHGP